MIVEFQFGLIAPSDSSEILKYPEKDKSEGAVQQELGQTQKPSEETPIRGTGRSRATHRFNFSRSEEKFLSFFFVLFQLSQFDETTSRAVEAN